MKLQTSIWIQSPSRLVLAGWAVVVAGLGLMLLNERLGGGLAAWSYDLPIRFGPREPRTSHLVLLELTDGVGGVPGSGPDRRFQAELIRRLSKAGVRLVFLDLIHHTASDTESDEGLASAMAEARNVVLAAGFRSVSSRRREALLPLPLFRSAAQGFGYAQLGTDTPLSLCRRVVDDSSRTNVNRVVAGLIESSGTTNNRPAIGERWIRYYGPPGRVFPKIQAAALVEEEGDAGWAEKLRGRIVYVGRNLVTGDPADSSDGRDRFPTPYSRLSQPGERWMPGYEVHATILENLLSGDQLTRLGKGLESGLVLGFGVVAVLLMLHLRRAVAIGVAVVLAVGIGLASFALVWSLGVWWSWVVAVAVQLPAALVLSVMIHVRQPQRVRAAYDVFLSYRREGGADTARLLHRELRHRKIRSFLDVAELGSDKFGDQLLQVIASCSHFIVILTPGTLDRCRQEDDWVRQEIRQAIVHRCKVIPVLKDGFQFPDRALLPEDIRALVDYNGVTYSHELFDSTLSKLVEFICRGA